MMSGSTRRAMLAIRVIGVRRAFNQCNPPQVTLAPGSDILAVKAPRRKCGRMVARTSGA